jgi:hypothetical protein
MESAHARTGSHTAMTPWACARCGTGSVPAAYQALVQPDFVGGLLGSSCQVTLPPVHETRTNSCFCITLHRPCKMMLRYLTDTYAGKAHGKSSCNTLLKSCRVSNVA